MITRIYKILFFVCFQSSAVKGLRTSWQTFGNRLASLCRQTAKGLPVDHLFISEKWRVFLIYTILYIEEKMDRIMRTFGFTELLY